MVERIQTEEEDTRHQLEVRTAELNFGKKVATTLAGLLLIGIAVTGNKEFISGNELNAHDVSLMIEMGIYATLLAGATAITHKTEQEGRNLLSTNNSKKDNS